MPPKLKPIVVKAPRGRISSTPSIPSTIEIQGEEPGRTVYSIQHCADKAKVTTVSAKTGSNKLNPKHLNTGAAESVIVAPPNKKPKVMSDLSCTICDVIFDEGETKVDCAVCNITSCFRCTKLPEVLKELAKTVGLESAGIPWLCNSCKVGLPRLTEMNNALQDIKKSNEERMSNLESRIDQIEENIETTVKEKMEAEKPGMISAVEKKVVLKLAKDMKEEISRVVKGEVASAVANELKKSIQGEVEREVIRKIPKAAHPQTISPGTHQRSIDGAAQELRDREVKKPNLILFKVKEPQTNLVEDMKRQDTEKFIEICGNMDIDLTKEKIRDCFRLGKKKTDGTDRPLIITLSDHTIKNGIFKNSARLAEGEFKDVSINNDLTKIQREQNKKMKEEARDMTKNEKSGNYVYRVVGPPWARKIKRVEKKQKEEVEEEEPKRMEVVADVHQAEGGK